MEPTPPFTRPLREPSPCGWNDGLRRPPTWAYLPAKCAIDTAGLHALLRAADLPREELLHMGAPPQLLASTAPVCWAYRPAALLLGRIAWDATHGQAGAAYAPRDLAAARALGQRVVCEWFS